jgi:hypothetical protein
MVPGPLVGSLFDMLISLGVAQPIRLSIQHVVERLLHGAADHLVEVALNLGIVNLNYLAQGFCLFCRFYCNVVTHVLCLQSG